MGCVKLLDCTLRDGGYINDWEFGHDNMINIFERLVSADVEIIEIGFLDERRNFDINRSIMPDTEAVNEIYGRLDKGSSIVVGMIDYGTCSIEKLMPCEESFLDGIRVIFKKQKMYEAIEFCKEVKKLGYKVFAQAVSITSYDKESFSDLLALVNELEPFAFSLVDTYGLLHKKDLMFYYLEADKVLKSTIGLGYHAHNNFQLAYSNCIEVLENPIERMLIIDGTLYGMGKSAGNAPIELLAMYMNNVLGKKYHISQMLEAIDVNILEIYRKTPWGYQFKFYLSALNDCHPNYVTHLTEKKKLSIKSVNEILEMIENEKKLLYDEDYIENLYLQYQKNECDDTRDIKLLRALLKDREILLLAPGNSIVQHREKINKFIAEKNPFIISVNFLPDGYYVNAVFISNSKRYVQMSAKLLNQNDIIVLATSNITSADGTFDYLFNYSALLDEDAMIIDNPLIMMIQLLKKTGVERVNLAGFDGYTKAEKSDYINPNMAHTFSKTKALELNRDASNSLRKFTENMKLNFITDSLYQL